MTDHLTRDRRSWNMRRIRSINTQPEIRLRKKLYSSGLRYRINYKKLPGKPDIIFPADKKAIFIHGCFWHRHGCKRTTMPKSNLDYWQEKFRSNVSRDKNNQLQLEEMGWKFMIVWECEIQNEFADVLQKVFTFLKK